MNWKPLRDLVMIERIDAPELSQGGISLLPKDLDTIMRGRVVAVGPGARSKGYWRKSGGRWVPDANGINHKVGGAWEWIEQLTENPTVKVGDVVVFAPFGDLLTAVDERTVIVPANECRWIESYA